MKLSSPSAFVKCLCGLLCALAGAANGVATERNVPGDNATLSQAVTASSSGDVIILNSDLTGSASVDLSSKALTIKSGSASPVTITAPASARIFSLNYGNSVVFDNLVFQGTGNAVGLTGAAITVSGGTTPSAASPSTVTLAGAFTVTGFNISGASTGAIYGGTTGSILSLGSTGKTVTVSNITAATGAGGAIRGWGLVSEGNLVIQNNTAAATAGGAGIYLSGAGLFKGTTSIIGNTITATTGSGASGAGIAASGGLHFIGDATISNNSTANGNGGGIRTAADIVFDGNVTLANNSAQMVAATSANGGGLWVGTNLTVGGAITASGNTAATNGGAISVSNGSLVIGSGSSFLNNTAGTGLGGAIYVAAPSGSVTSHRLDASTGDILFSGNTANGVRNGMYLALGSTAQTLELLTGAGHTISFLDALATSTSGVLTVNKNGSGTALFDTYASSVTATTNVNAGTLKVANGATYGSTATGTSLNVASGATLAGSGVFQAKTITLADGAKLRATDGGTLTLTATTLTPVGSVELSGNGTINTGALLTASAVMVEAGGVLELAQTATVAANGTLSGSGQIGGAALNLAGATSLNTDATLEVTSSLTGAGSLSKTGAGSAILSGANSYSGGTNIAAGSLTLTSGSAAGSGAISNSGTLIVNLSGTDTLANSISGSGGFTKTGAGTLTLSGANSYTGATTVSQGVLQLGAGSAATFQSVVLNGGTLDLNGHAATASGLSGTSAGTLALAGTTFTVTTPAATTQNYAGTITGDSASSLVKAGTGTLELSGTQPLATGFAGDITVTAGELDVSHGVLATTGDLTVQAGAALGLSAGSATVSAGTVTFGSDSVLNIIGASGQGTTDLVTSSAPIVGTASLRLNGAEVASTLDQYLSLQLTQSVDLRTLSLVSGLTWNNTSAAHGTFNVATGQSFTTPAALSDNTTFTTSLGNWDGRTLTKSGGGVLVFAAPNSYTGETNINAGTLRLDASDAIATSSRVSVASGATLQLGANQLVHELSGAGAINLGSSTLTNANASAATLSGVISGAGALVKSGAGTLTLSGQNTYSGGTTVSSGRVVVTSASALGTGAVTNNSELQFSGATGSFGGAIAGSGAVIKSGSGNLALTGATGSAGTVTVDGGTLTIGDGQSASSFTAGSVAVSTGTALTVDRNSTLSVSGALNLASNSTLNLVVGATSPVVAAGTANISTSGTTLNISGITGSASMPYTLLTTTGGITGDFANISIGGGSGASSDYLVVSAVKSGNSYVLGTNLVWNTASSNPNGIFTLASGEFFDLGVTLTNTTANASAGWDGKSFTKAGDGLMNMSATNTYTGSTSVIGGRLRFTMGDAIATSSSVYVGAHGVIELNNTDQHLNNLSGAGQVWLGSGRLTIGNTTDTAFSGVITGTGPLIKEGSGVLTLSGVNTYSGGTTLNGGRISLGNVNALGTGSVTNNGALEFAETATGTFVADISGSGSVTKLGSGLLTLTGSSGAFTGTTAVQGGILSVNGQLGGTLRIGSGATLQGNGTVGTTTALSGSHIAPGNSIGTLNVLGNLTFATGSTYDVEIAPDGTSDRINVSGTATIESGAAVQVTKAGTYTYGTRYTILTAGGGINGNFSELIQNAPLIDLIFFREGNSLYLDVRRNTIAFEAYARTSNQWAVAGAVEARGYADSIFRHITDALDEATVRRGFDQLSGEVHASFQSSLIDEAGLVREAQQSRDSELFHAPGKAPQGARAWAQMIGGSAQVDGGEQWADTTRSTFGVLAGVDNALSRNTRLGLVIGVTKSQLDADAVSSSIAARNVHIGVQGSTRLSRVPALTFSAGAGYSLHYADTARDPLITTFSEHLDGRRNGRTMQAFGEASWLIPTKRGGFEPFVNAAIVRVNTDAFSEKGGDSALLGAEETRTARLGTIGSRIVHRLGGSHEFRLFGSLGWQHVFEGASASQHFSYSGGDSFLISGTPLSRDTVAAEVGVGFELVRALRMDLGYSGRLSEEGRDHAARLVLSRSF